jgi:hypothetical protein
MSRHGALDTRTHKGLTINLYHDEHCDSPRENDNLGTIIAWHRNYRLSDKDAPTLTCPKPSDFDPKVYPICLPVYMLDHSGVALSTGSFGDPWDSGQVGWIYVTRDRLLKEYGVKRLSKRVLAQAEKVLKAEIEEYGQYVNGACYGYIVTDADGEQLDSCWGFIGSKWAWESGEQAADDEVERRLARADALTDAQRSEN